VQIRTNVVVVPVTVKDSHGQLVGDLTKDDFRILEDNIERPIRTFDAEPTPLSAVVLIDNDLAQKEAAQVQKSLAAIAAGFGPSDEVAVVMYDQYPTTVADFSKDNDKLFTELKRVEIGSHSSFVYPDPTTAGPTAVGAPPSPPNIADQVKGPPKYSKSDDLDDAVFSAGQMLQDRGNDRRKIVFLISDGSNSRNNKHTYAETQRQLLGSDISVYAILVNRTVPIGKSLIQHGASEIDRYAADTGGDTYYGAKEEDLSRMYSDVTEEARNRYTLTFVPGSTDTSHDYHSIEVRVARPGLNVRTRDGYYLSAVVAGH
jgi:VWFA-related protein